MKKHFIATRQPNNGWYLIERGETQGKYGATLDECLKSLAHRGDEVVIEILYYEPGPRLETQYWCPRCDLEYTPDENEDNPRTCPQCGNEHCVAPDE